ncbi:PAS domain-containing protein [uncultured Imperialibacter sp.]|uniref:PAS domain-containing protein n=1 Tax=uncultured Imperialibacter sp. TaxID=1672639 RepID=UPI0030D840CB|tara:strand:+ start:376 stop:2667 length:2292 start_codon:yes stop_codon:yes gene_type:complete
MPSKTNPTESKTKPLAGFWEWDIYNQQENISKSLTEALSLQHPFSKEEGLFWKTILRAPDFQSFINLRIEASQKKRSGMITARYDCVTVQGEVVALETEMETVVWSDTGEPQKMIGYVTVCLAENDLSVNSTHNRLLNKLTEQTPGALYQYQYLSNGLSRFPYASKGVWDIFEHTPNEIRADAAKAFERVHPHDLDAVIQSILHSYTTLNPWEQDFRVVLPSKGERWISGVATPEKQHDESVIWHGYMTDITDRKKTEQELQKANSDLQGILNAGSQISIISTDVDGIISHFSRGSENLLGYKAEEVVDKASPAIFHLKEEIDLRGKQLSARLGKEVAGFDVFVEMAKKGKHDTREWTYRKKDGSTFPVQLVVTSITDESDKIVGFLGIATDISQMKKARLALAESEERWQFALEGAGDGAWDWDLAKGSIFISPKSKKMLGYASHEVRNAPEGWAKLIHADDVPTYQKNLDQHLQGKAEIYSTEYRVLCKNGEYKWVLDRGKVTRRDEDGRPLRIIGTHSDISQAKEKEEALKSTIDIIGEQNRRLLNFAHIVSHNLRSHSGNFEMMFEMLDETEDRDEQKEILTHIRTISEKLAETIHHLNEVVMVQTSIDLQRQNINLHNYVEKTREVLTANISSKNAHIVNNIPREIVINHNAAYMESILLNLLSNAVKYSHPDRRPEVHLTAYSEKNYTVLEVADNGLGINLHLHRDKLFGMYKTFHPNKDAKGIGLFITRNQIEAMGGRIEVESEENKGSVFKVYFL